MNLKLINQPLGNVTIGIQKKEMPLPLAIPIALAAGSLVSSMWGAKKSADAAKEAEKKTEQQKVATENERRLRKNQTWAETASGQETLRQVQQQNDRELAQIQGAAKVGGATDAAVARGKEQLNERQAEVLARSNANYEQQKDIVDAQYRQEINNLNQQQIAAEQQKAQAVAQAAGAASSALATGAMMTFGGTKAGQKLFSPGTGSPGGGGVYAPSTEQVQRMGNNYNALKHMGEEWNERLGMWTKSA